MKAMQIVMTSEILLAAYAQGLFPMAESANSPYVHWYCPQMRGQLSITDMHIPRKLAKAVRRMEIGGLPYEIRVNSDFAATIKACAQASNSRPETWINDTILKAYCDLHAHGHAHSLECWQGGRMVGGLYGVAIGGAFFGESMFSTATDASKVALVHLVARLWRAGYVLLDTQFVNDHLRQFGVYEVTYRDYMRDLGLALHKGCDFTFMCNEAALTRDYLDLRI